MQRGGGGGPRRRRVTHSGRGACTGGRRSRALRTFVLEWTDPPIGAGHWTPGLVELAGGDPVLASAADAKVLGWDAIVAADPDVVIVAPCGFDLAAAQRAVDDLAANPAWRSLRALRDGRTYVVDGNAYVNRPGPRLVDTAEIFARFLHGVESDAARGAHAWLSIAP